MILKSSKHIRLYLAISFVLVATIFSELLFIEFWDGSRDSGPDVLVVASPAHEWMRGRLSPYGPGFERELLDRFTRESGKTWVWRRTESWEEAWRMLAEGRADMVPGLGAEPPETYRPMLYRGPAYAAFKPLIVRSSKRYGLRRPEEICEVGVLLPKNPVLVGALYQQAEPLRGCSPQPVVSHDHAQEPILATLQSNQARFALVDSGRFMLWQPFFSQVRPVEALDREVSYRWYWRDDSLQAATLKAFWKRTKGSAWIKDLYERYFGFLPKETDYYQLSHLNSILEEGLKGYGAQVAASSFKNRLDPLLLTAVIYQESHFSPLAESCTGVRGLMQITQATAEELGIDRLDPGQSIVGGSAYLKQLYKRLEPYGLSRWDRWFFALAAYNQGWGHLTDAMDLSRKLGDSGRTWRELKRAFPLLSRSKYYKDSEYGYTRGREAVEYVDSIRYYYYVLKGLVVLSRPEAEQLPALIPAVAQAGF